MVGCVKYGLDCWMMDVEGKCSADAVARGLPACMWAGREGRQGLGGRGRTEDEGSCWSEHGGSRGKGRMRQGLDSREKSEALASGTTNLSNQGSNSLRQY